MAPNQTPLQPVAHGYLVLAATGCPTAKIPVTDAEQASALWCRYRDAYGFGCSKLKRTSGNLVNANGKVIAKVGYNGNIFNLDDTLLWGVPYKERAEL